MKRVVDKHTVAHLWANRLQRGARTQTGNFYFEGDRIWSYGSHFLIGYHTENGRGEHAVIITRQKYSVTTTDQVHIVCSASNHLHQLIVPDAGLSYESLLDKWYEEITTVAANLQRARKPEKYSLRIRELFNEAKRYADFYDFELPARIKEAGMIEHGSQYSALLQKEAEYRKIEAAKIRLEEKQRQRKQLKDWRAFKADYIKQRDGFDYLRFDKTNNRIQTSQKVKIPLAVAKAFYALILSHLALGGCKACNLTLMDRYPVTEINRNFISVGCHKITIKEIHLITQKLGW